MFAGFSDSACWAHYQPMTYPVSSPLAEPPLIHVVMVAYPDAHVLDITGPMEVLSGVKLFRDGGVGGYELTLVAAETTPIRTTSGLSLVPDMTFEQARGSGLPIDVLMVAGGHGTQAALKDRRLMEFAAWADQQAKRVISICTGAFILAELGLLDGKRAATHWWWCPVMAKRYPAVELDADAIYVRDGKYWTSAGVTAGMDLALALVEADWGHDMALKVARYNVMYMMRPGGQAQFSAQLVAQQVDDGPINRTLEHILSNLTDELSVADLASLACMSERSFARKFKRETGETPAAYVEQARLQDARVRLEQSDDTIDLIALKSGFGAAERMRRAFHKHLGVTVRSYRERFRPNRTEADA